MKTTKHCSVDESGTATLYCVIPKEELKNIKGDFRIITGELSEDDFYQEYGKHESFQSAEYEVINSLCDYLKEKNNFAKCRNEITRNIKNAYPDLIFTDKNFKFECDLDFDYSEDRMFEKYNIFNENGDLKCKFLVNYDCCLDFYTEKELTTEDDFDIDDEDYDDEDKRDDLKLECILFNSLKDNLFKDNSVVKEVELLEWDNSFEKKEELVQNQNQNKLKSKKMSL